MNVWLCTIIVAAVLLVGGALYICLGWRRSPRAYRAMFVLAACYFVAGSMVGAWVLHLLEPRPTISPTQVAVPSAEPSASSVVPTLRENYTGPSFTIPPLHYDPANAILPDPKLTPATYFRTRLRMTFARRVGRASTVT